LIFYEKKGVIMVDSQVVLYGQTIAYTIYCIIILLLMGWFGLKITRTGKSNIVKPAFFYIFVIFLACLGVSLHLITYSTIPWAHVDLNRGDYKPDKIFQITAENHKFKLPSEKMIVKCNELVRFDVKSNDLTYGFGLFRKDNSMLFQMQVVPGHYNDVLWMFEEPGLYSIRSTEYSGPAGIFMVEKDVVEVVANP
jgi:cytochrome c oxidase subunit II